jgi:hypothetical protein
MQCLHTLYLYGHGTVRKPHTSLHRLKDQWVRFFQDFDSDSLPYLHGLQSRDEGIEP